MKKLSYGRMAAARLRAGKKAYLGLGLGIFLSVFLVTSVFLALYGVVLQKKEEKENRVGKVDAVVMDEPDWSDDDILALGIYDKVGHVSVMASVGESGLYFGWPDETAQELMEYQIEAGRLPERSGEIAAERSALMALELPEEIGSEVSLTLTPVDGISEERCFTLVGILSERASFLENDTHDSVVSYADDPVLKFPALLASADEESFATGRLAVHRLLLLRDGIGLQKLQKEYKALSIQRRIFAADWQGTMQLPFEALLLPSLANDRSALTLLMLILLLGLSLLVSSGVVISSSMESILSSRKEEIGILRAIGASKRQIRRIFGRDVLILSVFLLPLSVLFACGFTAFLASQIPELLHFGFSFWLILPICAVSLICVMTARRRPLKRSSEQLPMSVLRDTGLLRRAMKVKSHPSFRIDRLLAKRQRKLYPGRERSTAIFLFFMTFCSGMLVLCAAYGLRQNEQASFTVWKDNYLEIHEGGFLDYSGHELNDTDLAQIRSFPHVTGVEIECSVGFNLLLEQDSTYFGVSGFDFGPGHHMDDESQAAVQKLLGTQSAPVPNIFLLASDRVLEQTIQARPSLASARDSISRGEAVIVQVPTWWEDEDEHGWYVAGEARDPEDTLTMKNDYFHLGKMLDLALLYIKQPIPGLSNREVGTVFSNLDKTAAERLTLKVGGLVEDKILWPYASEVVLLTDMEGMRHMNLPELGVCTLSVYTDDDMTRKQEQELEKRLSAILRRSENYSLTNQREQARQEQARYRMRLLLFAALAAVFFTVSVGLVVSGTARKLQDNIRSIGMLRAVGAEERDLVKSYRQPLIRNAVFAFAAAEILFIVLCMSGRIVNSSDSTRGAFMGSAAMAAFALLCVLCSSLLIRQKVKRITDQSIIDNIREL